MQFLSPSTQLHSLPSSRYRLTLLLHPLPIVSIAGVVVVVAAAFRSNFGARRWALVAAGIAEGSVAVVVVFVASQSLSHSRPTETMKKTFLHSRSPLPRRHTLALRLLTYCPPFWGTFATAAAAAAAYSRPVVVGIAPCAYIEYCGYWPPADAVVTATGNIICCCAPLSNITCPSTDPAPPLPFPLTCC